MCLSAPSDLQKESYISLLISNSKDITFVRYVSQVTPLSALYFFQEIHYLMRKSIFIF